MSPRYTAGISETIDVYAGAARLGSITRVHDQWVPVCAVPDLASSVASLGRRRLVPSTCCGLRLLPHTDPIVAKGRLIAHHGDRHDMDEAA